MIRAGASTALLLLALFAQAAVGEAFAQTGDARAQAQGCLSKDQQRAAIASGQVVPLAQAVRAARGGARSRSSDVLSARLCRDGGNLFYQLTLLSRDGKVWRSRVEANSGRVVETR